MDYIPLFQPFLLLLVPLSSPPPPSPIHIPPSLFLSPLLRHSTKPPALRSCPRSYVFQSFILVFPVPREYSLHISSEHSHRLLSWCNSVADIPSCTNQSLVSLFTAKSCHVDMKFKITSSQCIWSLIC